MSHFSVSTGPIGNHVPILPLKGGIKLASLIVYLRPNESRRIFLFCPLARFPFAFPWPCLKRCVFLPFFKVIRPSSRPQPVLSIWYTSQKVIRPVAQPRGARGAVYRPRYIALLDISSTPIAARDAVYRPRYIAPLEYSSTPNSQHHSKACCARPTLQSSAWCAHCRVKC